MIFYIRESDNVYIVLLSNIISTSYTTDPKDMVYKENVPIWKTGKHKDVIVATSNLVTASYLRYENFLEDDELSEKALTLSVAPKIKEKLKNLNLAKDELPNSIFFARGGEIYRMTTSGATFIEGESFAVGDYAYVGIAALNATKGMPAMDRIKEVVKIVSAVGAYKECPFIVMDTKKRKLKVVNKI
ncbi:MAG: hypothetical protein IJS93_01630 [Clostridia bacterium]|nr:hypothetical protein [Clostridia bacterium]